MLAFLFGDRYLSAAAVMAHLTGTLFSWYLILLQLQCNTLIYTLSRKKWNHYIFSLTLPTNNRFLKTFFTDKLVSKFLRKR